MFINTLKNLVKLSTINNKKIDFFFIIRLLYINKKLISFILLIFTIIGIIVSLNTKTEYTSKTLILPQTNNSSSSINLSQIASIAGIDYLSSSNSNSPISPLLYSNIIRSIPFKKELLKTELSINGNKNKITLKDYYKSNNQKSILFYIKDYTIGLPSKILSLLFHNSKSDSVLNNFNSNDNLNKSLIVVSSIEQSIFNQIQNNLFIELDNSKGIVTISGIMPEAIASSELTLSATNLLQKFIIDIMIQKSKEQFNFLEKRYTEVRNDFISKEAELAEFMDRNLILNTYRSEVEKRKLQSEYDLLFSLYNQLANELEAQRLNVKKDTPVFVILEPVSIPHERSKPIRSNIVKLWFFSGFMFSVFLIFFIHFLIYINKYLK